MRRGIEAALLFLMGAVVGTTADQIHVKGGVLSYAHPSPLLSGQAFWVPLLFGTAAIAMTVGHAAITRLTLRGREAPRGSAVGFAATVLAFYAAYASTAVFQDTPKLLTAALVLAWAGRVAVAPAADKWIGGVLLAIAGSLFEAALSSPATFHYRQPDVLGVPAWLPALYLHASLMIREGYLAFFAHPGRARELRPETPG